METNQENINTSNLVNYPPTPEAMGWASRVITPMRGGCMET